MYPQIFGSVTACVRKGCFGGCSGEVRSEKMSNTLRFSFKKRSHDEGHIKRARKRARSYSAHEYGSTHTMKQMCRSIQTLYLTLLSRIQQSMTGTFFQNRHHTHHTHTLYGSEPRKRRKELKHARSVIRSLREDVHVPQNMLNA